MSANLDLVRSIYADWERGHYGSVDWAHPEIEYVFVGGPEPGTWTGVVAMARAWREFLSAWEDYSIVAEEYRELDDERVLVLDRRSGRGKTSGLEIGQVDAGDALVFHIRDGKVIRFIGYFDRDRALADLGLEQAMSEEPMTPDLEEVLRQGVEALNRRDFDAAIAAFSRDGVWDMSALGVGVFTGHEAIRGLFEDWIGAYEDFEIEIEENLDLGNGVVLEVFVQKGRPLGSIGHLELRYAHVFVFVGGIIERTQGYTDIDEARAAAERFAEERGLAVSRENVEVLREILDEFANTHRLSERLMTPDFVWDMGSFRGWLEKQEYTGPAEFYEFFATWTGPYEDWDMAPPDLRELDHDRVLALLIQRGRLRGADSWVELHYGTICTVTGGQVSRVQVFGTWEDALEAARPAT